MRDVLERVLRGGDTNQKDDGEEEMSESERARMNGRGKGEPSIVLKMEFG